MKTFKEAYGVLSRHATTLRNQQEPNIDDLLQIVTESMQAYQVCKERIDAVEKALEQALADAPGGHETPPPVAGPERDTQPALPDEDDIPF